MEFIDYVLYALLGLFIVWCVARLIATAGRITLPGQVPGMTLATVVVLGLLGYGVYSQREQFANVWILFAGIVVGMVLYSLIRVGLCGDGVYYKGKLLHFAKIDFYMIEPRGQGHFVLRLHMARRDYALLFQNAQKEAVIAHLVAGQVPPMERKDQKRGKTA